MTPRPDSETEPTAPSMSAADGSSIDRQMAKGAAWMVVARLLDRCLGLVSIMILARLLVPADFGLVAMASSIIAMIELLGMFGFDMALIQNPDAGREHYDTAWTFSVLFSVGLAAAQIVAAAPAAWFYGEPRLQAVIPCLAVGTLIVGFENIGVVAFRKELRFSKDFNLGLAKKLIVFAITVPTALALRNYWALVIGLVVGRLVGVILTYVAHPYRPRLSLAARHSLFNFGKWMVVNNVLGFVGSRCADILLGKAGGPQQLGLFNLAYEIATLPSSDLISPVNRAIFPGYARKAADPSTLGRSYLDVLGLVALIALPAGVGIAAVSDLLVPVVLGPAWAAAAPCVALLALYGVLLAIKSNNHYVYLAMGRPWIATTLGAVQIALLLPLVTLGAARSGAFGASVGYLIAQAIFTPISWAILCGTLRLGPGRVLGVLHRPIIATAAMYLGVWLTVAELRPAPSDGAALLLPLLLCVAIGVVLYVGILYALWGLASKPLTAESQVLDLIRKKLWPHASAGQRRIQPEEPQSQMKDARALGLRVGDIVEVRSEQEILATLDENGALDGLPFMPEMLAFCGQRLRVDKRADKTCDTIHYSGSRRMHDTVHLAAVRCNGAAHGGCQAGCLIFWKEAWLRRTAAVEPTPAVDRAGGRERLLAATRVPQTSPEAEPIYRCQATDLLRASAPMPWWDVRQYVRDVTSGNVRIRDVVEAGLFRIFLHLLRFRGYRLLMASYGRLQAWRGATPFPYTAGTLEKTPRATLELKPGELVRVKSQEQILATVDRRNRNRGLSFDAEMVRYCGQIFRVLARVERIVDERTGRIISLSSDCIVLEGVYCRAEYSNRRLFCPRSLYPFWREIWLERVTEAEATASTLGSPCAMAEVSGAARR